ncbi:TonB-dependent receptor [uncultured Acetobacteroides sp.]|uniref:SusC/RagA family TonB-linked outer membrane protein n=1 Tax=uncultured Acetobacteroides sp. TaxID=1760811 RepID=UPI0029F4968C|nr:TonB-dependent receptor [uncultured Acetobacteroides sp.]
MKNISIRFLLLLAFWGISSAMAQTQEVAGVVKDEKGELLPGVSVQVVGTTVGTSTSIDGTFKLKVKDLNTSVLRFSFVGMQNLDVPIKGQKNLVVTMKSASVELEEVVAIGYGFVKKRDLTGAVSSLKTTEIVKTASNNALQSMQGKVAGLDITKSSGESGAGINISLRGNRSVIASNAPLFLVDGIEYGSTLDINSSDIESMEVLKDASSTAIYGTRGANGVVIITTKRGSAEKNGGKTRVTLNSYLSFNSPTNLPKLMNAQEEYLFQAERKRYNAEKGTLAWGTTNLADYPADKVLSTVVSSPYEKSVYDIYKEGGVDWFDMIMRNSTTQNYEVAVSGGSGKTSFNLSLGYMKEEGLLRNDDLSRYNGRLNIDHSIANNLKIGASIQYTYRDWARRADNVYSQLIKMHTLAQPYFANGDILDKPSELATSHTNPLLNEVPGYYQNNTQSNRLFSNVFLDWEIVKNLRFKTILGVDQNSNRYGEYEDYMCTGNYQSGRGSAFEVQNNQSLSYTWENTLNYSTKLGANHDFQFLLGQSSYQSTYEMHGLSGTGLQDHYGKNSFYELSNIIPGGRTIANNYIKKNMLSYFGRVNYKLFNRYLLTASLRSDGSSALSKGNKWGYFPSISGAWVISDESFFEGINSVSNLKLRASWGKSGNSAVEPYSTLTVLGADKVYNSFGSSLISGQVPANFGDPNLTWETTKTYDLGLDLSLFNNRISTTVDAYYSRTYNLLLYKGLPATSAYPQVLTNVGTTENRGIEATLNIRAIEKHDFSWNTNFSFSMNRDKIVELASGAHQDLSLPGMALIVGKAARAFYDYEADGCWSIAEAAKAKTYNRVPGDIKIVDRNNDGVINESDKRIYNQSPNFILGWNNTLSYKGISLSALMYARVGQWIQYDYNTAYKPTEADGSPAVDFWTPENQGAKFPRPGIASQNDMPALAYEKASFFKIKEVTLGYQLPSKLTSKIGMSKLYVYGSMQNYFTFSNLDNYDPERGGAISSPLAKQLIVGLNIEF